MTATGSPSIRCSGSPACPSGGIRSPMGKAQIAGGKERLRSLFSADLRGHPGIPAQRRCPVRARRPLAQTENRDLHRPHRVGRDHSRTGVSRLAEAAAQAGWRLAVASTSAEPSVQAVLERAIGDDLATEFSVLAGDLVPEETCPRHLPAALDRPGLRMQGSGRHRGLSRGRQLGPARASLPGHPQPILRRRRLSGGRIMVSDLGDPGLPPVDVVATVRAPAWIPT